MAFLWFHALTRTVIVVPSALAMRAKAEVDPGFLPRSISEKRDDGELTPEHGPADHADEDSEGERPGRDGDGDEAWCQIKCKSCVPELKQHPCQPDSEDCRQAASGVRASTIRCVRDTGAPNRQEH